MDYLKILLAIPKTIWFNFRYLPFCQAVKLPVWLSLNTKSCISGGVMIKGKVRPFMIRIGFHECNECNPKDKTVLTQV